MRPRARGRGAGSAGPDSYTAQHLADKIASPAATLEGERKQVTVMFTDVQSSMELAESVDSETWRTVMSASPAAPARQLLVGGYAIARRSPVDPMPSHVVL